MEGIQDRLTHGGLNQSLSDSSHPSVCSDVRLLVGTCWRPDPRRLVGLQKEASRRHSQQMSTHLRERRRRRPNSVKAATYGQTICACVIWDRKERHLRLKMPEICSHVNPHSSPRGTKTVRFSQCSLLVPSPPDVFRHQLVY